MPGDIDTGGHPGGGGGGTGGGGGGGGSTGGSGGGSGGSGGSSGGSSGGDGAARTSLVKYIRSLGIPISDAMRNLIDAAVAHNWTQDQFMAKLRKTGAYQQRFPGRGSQTEAEYLANEKLFRSYANQAGMTLGKKQLAYLFRNKITPDEYADRVVALKRLTRNDAFYNSMRREALQAGLKPKEVSRKDMFELVMGEKPKEWYDLYQDTLTRYSATQSGLRVKNARNKDTYLAIGQKAMERISNMDLTEAEMGQKFEQMAELLGTVLPMTEAQLFGVSKKTILNATFGGKQAQRAKQKIEKAVKTHEAFSEDRANPPAYATEGGGMTVQGVSTDKQSSEL